LKLINAFSDVEKSIHSKKLRAGKGKARNRRYVLRKGPLIIYEQKSTLCRAFRNLPGVDLCCVTRLNLLQLAPGGHLGRFIIWTSAAYQRLESLYGSYGTKSREKIGYTLPRGLVTTSNMMRLLKSPEITTLLRKRRKTLKKPHIRKNPLKNLQMMIKLNPYAKALRRKELLKSHPGVKARVALHDSRKKARREAVKKAREKKGFTPKPNTVPEGVRLPLLEYLKKTKKIPNRRLQKLEKAKAEAKEKQEAKKKEKSEAPGEKDAAKEDQKKKKKTSVVRRVGRQPLPGGLRTRSKRYDPQGLKEFRDLRQRLLQKADKLRYKSIIPRPKPGEKPFVEFHKIHKKEKLKKTKAQRREAAKKKKEKAPVKDTTSATPKKKKEGTPRKKNEHVVAFKKLLRR
jgi:hypothetical protein